MKLERSEENDPSTSDGDAGDYGRTTATASRYTSATGNEADIEDNVLPPPTPTPVMLSEMLRMKPPECAPTTPCRILSEREEFMKNGGLRSPSTAERLTLRPKSAIETITDTIERPKGAVPPLALPDWHGMSLDKKIPGIKSPAGLLYYSPGKCCTQDELWKMEQEQLKRIRQFLSKTEGKQAERRKKLDAARNISKEMMNYRYRYKQQQQEVKLIDRAKERERINVERAYRGCAKSRLQEERRKALAEDQKRAAAHILQQSVLKVLRSMERKKEDALMIKRVHENQLLEWMESKINQSRERVDTYNRVELSLRESLRINAATRQRRVEARRRNLSTAIEKKKALEAYRWKLARKYFYVWLHKVRKHLSESRVDSDHESCWIKGVAGTLEETVKYLRFQTDTHERLDNFILSIIRLKNEIKKQLEEEEALEAAEEAATQSQQTVETTQESDYKEPPVPELELVQNEE